MNTPLERLVRMLCAGFSNQVQAFENPPLFAHILIKFRPLPQLEPGSLLLEQSYAIDPGVPYRIRVLQPKQTSEGLIILNHALHDDRRFWGGVDDEQRRALIRPADLRPLEGCTYLVKETATGFQGEVEHGCRCLVERKGTKAYLVSSFELDSEGMCTIDRGHDPSTHEQLWGSQAGAFQFERTHDFSDEIPAQWVTTFVAGAA